VEGASSCAEVGESGKPKDGTSRKDGADCQTDFKVLLHIADTEQKREEKAAIPFPPEVKQTISSAVV
jgi:hypothetical protein